MPLSSSETHLIVGGSGILGYALASRLSWDDHPHGVYITSRRLLPDYFQKHTNAVHVPFCDHHCTSSILSVLEEVRPDVVWYLLSDNDNSQKASISSSLLTNLSYPVNWLSSITDTFASARFMYASSILASDPEGSYYAATKSVMSSLLSNNLLRRNINISVFSPTSLIGPGEQRSSRLLPSVLRNLSNCTHPAVASPDQRLTYTYSIALATSLLDFWRTEASDLYPQTHSLQNQLSVGQLTEYTAVTYYSFVKLSISQMLAEYNKQLSTIAAADWQTAVRTAVLHFLLYDLSPKFL
jgi:nucleoside-diphosphate-sugar epimerase